MYMIIRYILTPSNLGATVAVVVLESAVRYAEQLLRHWLVRWVAMNGSHLIEGILTMLVCSSMLAFAVVLLHYPRVREVYAKSVLRSKRTAITPESVRYMVRNLVAVCCFFVPFCTLCLVGAIYTFVLGMLGR